MIPYFQEKKIVNSKEFSFDQVYSLKRRNFLFLLSHSRQNYIECINFKREYRKSLSEKVYFRQIIEIFRYLCSPEFFILEKEILRMFFLS